MVEYISDLLQATAQQGNKTLKLNPKFGTQKQYGPPSFHGTPLTVSWLLIIDFAVLIAALRWQRYSYYIHVFLALIVVGLTLAATIPLLMSYFLYKDRDENILKVHKTAGFIVVAWMGFQCFTGILSRIIQYSLKVSAKMCLWVKRFHNISGYIVMVLAKFGYLNVKWSTDKVQATTILIIIADVVFIAIYIWIKFAYWTLSEQIADNQTILTDKQLTEKQIKTKQDQADVAKQTFQQLQSPQYQLGKLKVPKLVQIETIYDTQLSISLEKYVLFNDFVYDTSKFTALHPGGEYLITLMNKRQISRFMNGSYSAELTPNIKPYNHSQGSMKLCGPPVAKIQRMSPIRPLNDYNKVIITYSNPITTSGSTYLIHLKNLQNNLSFSGFQQQKQIGQYFSLTISNQSGRDRVTRLYTTIWCMRPQNINFMKNCIPELNQYFLKTHNPQIEVQDINLINYLSEQKLQSQIIPLVIKKYEKGQLTPRLLHQNFTGQIVISKPLGCGMKLDQISQFGKVIIVCGGTGLLPFCDYIDLLFKRVKYLEQTSVSSSLKQNDSLIAENLIKNREFKIYCAAQSASDLLYLTLYQVNYLCNSDKITFQAIFRIKNNDQNFSKKFRNIKTQKGYFNENLLEDIKTTNICQIYICGSPEMNASIGGLLNQNKLNQKLYHFM